MPYYRTTNSRKYFYSEEHLIVSKLIAPGKFPLFAARDFGDIVGNQYVVLLKRHARILSRDNFISDEFGDALRQFLGSTIPGDLLQPVKILKVDSNPNHPSVKTNYVIVFDNGASLAANYLEAVLNHPTMTIHGIDGGEENVALMVDGVLAGVVVGASYFPELSTTLWDARDGRCG